MAIKLDSLRADTRRETDGDWIDIPDLPGLRLRVRGTAYGPFQTDKSLVEARWARKYGRDPVPLDQVLRSNGKLYADHILLGWDGLDEPYSPEKAAEVLADPAFRQLHEHIRYAMAKVSETETEFVEDAAKN